MPSGSVSLHPQAQAFLVSGKQDKNSYYFISLEGKEMER